MTQVDINVLIFWNYRFTGKSRNLHRDAPRN